MFDTTNISARSYIRHTIRRWLQSYNTIQVYPSLNFSRLLLSREEETAEVQAKLTQAPNTFINGNVVYGVRGVSVK